MLFKVVDDWKQNLHTDDEVRLNEILRNVVRHRAAYRTAKDVKNAQLWCALLELDKKTQDMNYNMEKLQMIIEGFADVIRRAEGGDSCGSGRSCGCESRENRCAPRGCCDEEPKRSRGGCCEDNYGRRDTKLIESLEKF